MTDKHTPGPWEAGAFGSIGPNTLDKPVAFTRRHNPDGLPYMSTEEETANARLIAAAPEMYDLLVEVERWTCDDWDGESFAHWRSDVSALLERHGLLAAKGDA